MFLVYFIRQVQMYYFQIKFIVLSFIYNRMHPPQAYIISMSLGKFTCHVTTITIKEQKKSITCKSSFVTLLSFLPSPAARQPSVCFVSSQIRFSFLELHIKVIMLHALTPTSLTQHDVFMIRPGCYVYQQTFLFIAESYSIVWIYHNLVTC